MGNSEQHDRQVKVRLSADQYGALASEAATEERSLSQYLRRLLVRHLDRANGQVGAGTAGA